MIYLRNLFLYTVIILSAFAGLLIGDFLNLDNLNKTPEQQAAVVLSENSRLAGESTVADEEAQHPQLEVDPNLPVPSVQIEAVLDEKSGVNARLSLTNFTLTPQSIGGVPVANQGHVHLFVNGKKITRIYADWFYIPADWLIKGENEIRVTLNADDHSELLFEGQHIQDSVTIGI